MDDITLRPARPDDLPAITAIYAHHVLNGTATFEIDPPSLQEMTARFTQLTEQRYPYLVAEDGSRVLGYAYAGPYRPRPAYRYSVEDSIYLAPEAIGRGIGKRLLMRLIAECEALGFRQMLAVIGDSENAASIGLHRACGFTHKAVLDSIGAKFGRWVDTVLMQRALGDGARGAPQ
jgi:phosphinothricin acetyltransferase